jgi:septal ring factor EnvC (AmiA/AmiB activator)
MTVTTVTDRTKLRNKIASLDMEICEKKYELAALQEEIDDLEVEHSELLDELDDLGEDEES